MILSDFDWKIRYRSDKDDLLNDFYVPALERSVLYQRAAGFFSSSSLAVAAKGVIGLIRNNGRMKLIMSPLLNKEDIKILEEGYTLKEKIAEQAMIRNFEFTEDKIQKRRLEALAWMIAEGLLDFKIALPSFGKSNKFGLYHEKMGIFTDKEGNVLTFSGSINESRSAYLDNFESFDVQFSWEDGRSKELAMIKANEFQEMWNCKNKSLEIINIPSAIKEKLLQYKPKAKPEFEH